MKAPTGPAAQDQPLLKFNPIKANPIAGPAQGPSLQDMRAKFLNTRKNEINQSSRAAQQEAGDALNRRFSSMGMANSGAAMGVEMKTREALEAQKQAAMGEIAGLEMQGAEGDEARRLQSTMFDVEQGNQMNQLDLARRQLQFDRSDTEFNKWLAQKQLTSGGGGGGGK
jgi:hypothetical protein